MADTAPTNRTRCIYLCCKSMVVYGEGFENDPDYQSGQVDFWCVQTSKGLGPDGAEASMATCCNAERSCFQEY
ncbi:MAG TPA: hypothetical protein VK395_26020 [Gemmataceae bacterium]|nr:hypothetical protein [Gemmataceae bacterium]